MRNYNLPKFKLLLVISIIVTYFSLSCSTVQTITKTINNEQDSLQSLGKVKVFEPKNGRLMDSLTIVAMDGSFVLESGKPFKPTFYTPGWVNPNSEFVKAFKKSTKGRKVKLVIKRNIAEYEDGKPITTTSPSSTPTQGSSALDKFLTTPKPTSTSTTDPNKKIKYRQVTETLYGLLEFNSVHEACSNEPTTRAYYISIPQNYIESAKGGNISVIYEYYQCEPIAGKGKNKYTSWVLWLSDIEF